MKRQHVNSSSILTAGYEWDAEKESGTLEIEFSSGGVYAYIDVPRHVWNAFMATDRKGGYFIFAIKGKYQYTCVKSADKKNAKPSVKAESGRPLRKARIS